MDIINLEEQEATPRVALDPTNGTLFFSGKSFSDNIHNFYEPILEWVEEYCKNPAPNTVVEFDFEYFNTSASKVILRILKTLEVIHFKNESITVKWIFEEDDEDMQDSGEEYALASSIPFQIIERPER